MRKVFIDGGANKGQSTAKFLKEWPNSNEFEIFMFEPNSIPPQIKGENTKLIRKALWIYDGEIEFYEKRPSSEGNTLIEKKSKIDKNNFKKHIVQCLSLSNWINSNLTKDDYVVLKLDVEGAEYEIIKDLETNGCFDLVDVLFCEIHGLKCGKTYEESLELITICESSGLKLYSWDASSFKYKTYEKRFYDEKLLTEQFDKWKKRGLK